MKKIITTIAVSAFALLMTACKSDLLDLSPYDSVSSGNMWTTENLTDKGVLGVYSTLNSGFGGLYPYYYEMFSSSMTMRNGSHSLLLGTCTSGDGYFSSIWKGMYEGINRANDAISNLPNSPLSDAKRARLIAEVKFLRAYYYYRLNVLFRGVPLYLEPTELDGFTKPRNTVDEVWEAILKDLTDCIGEANMPDKYAPGDSNYGRITKGAAYALRGKIYMWQKNWSAAESDLRKVGTMGFDLYDGNYKDLFKEANEQCSEMVFTVQCMGLDGYGNDLSFRYGSRSAFGGCWNNYFPSTDFVDTYDYADGKPFDWDEALPGYSSMTTKARSAFFLRDGLTEAEKTKMSTYGADLTQYKDSGNEERIRKIYETRDPRLTATIITPYSEYTGSIGGVDVVVTLRWPWRKETGDPYDLRTDTNALYYYLYRKFVAEGTSEIPNRTYSPIDVPVIRYADVLLDLAEALNEQNKTSEAVTLVNKVRKRAGVALLNSNTYTTVAGQSDMRNRIRKERRWEFNGEGVTYFDELRWGTWKEAVFFDGAGLKQIWGTPTQSYSYQGSYSETWAIPRSECEMNSNLEQNPGWIN